MNVVLARDPDGELVYADLPADVPPGVTARPNDVVGQAAAPLTFDGLTFDTGSRLVDGITRRVLVPERR